jgi:hypothetical protein
MGFDSGIVALLAPAVLAAVITYAAYMVMYNMFFHPLADFPGPPMGAITIYWKAYVECIANRSFCHELIELHARYGMTIAQSPAWPEMIT